jgi:16S rRNA G527 N7-methylase RsmG
MFDTLAFLTQVYNATKKKENVYLYNRTLEEMDGKKKSYDMWAIRALSKSDSMVGPVKDLSC